MGKKKDLRRKIAKQVKDKMYYLNSCPNEKDIILNIILPKEDRIPFHSHCKRDCLDIACEANIDIDNQIVIRKVTR